MSAMDDVFGDDFPGRPDHQDFWKLSDIVLKHDGRIKEAPGRMESEFAFALSVSEIIDLNSLTYMAYQRACKALGIKNRQELDFRVVEVASYVSLYIDAFLLGAEFQKDREGR